MLTEYSNLGRYFFCLTLLLVLTSCSKEDELYEEGISKQLAEQRKKQLSNITYDLFFDIPVNKTEKIESKITIGFDLFSTEQEVLLDFTADPSLVESIEVNGEPVEPIIQNQHLIIENDYLKEKNEIIINYIAGEQSLNRNDEFLYTLFVPARASSCFPLFDQPDLKAKFKLSLLIPKSWEAISNTRVLETKEQEAKRLLQFGQTKMISSYLFAFAAGEFKKDQKPLKVGPTRCIIEKQMKIKLSRMLALSLIGISSH